MSDNKFLDHAIELIDIVENIKPRDYFKSKLPNHIDQKIMEICTSVMEGTSDQRYEFVSLLDREAIALLDIFSHRMTMVSVRENSYDYLLKGLVALTFAAITIDYREILMTISLFYQSAVKLNIDLKQLFTTASQYATTESARKLIMEFLDRLPENKGIDKMGFKEVYGPSGLIYQFGNQPIPDGWL